MVVQRLNKSRSRYYNINGLSLKHEHVYKSFLIGAFKFKPRRVRHCHPNRVWQPSTPPTTKSCKQKDLENDTGLSYVVNLGSRLGTNTTAMSYFVIPDSQPPSPQPPSPQSSEPPSPVNTHDPEDAEVHLTFRQRFTERSDDPDIGWFMQSNDQDIFWPLNQTNPEDLIEYCTRIAVSKDGASVSANIRNAQGPFVGSSHVWRIFITGSDKFSKNKKRTISPPEDSPEEMFKQFLNEAYDSSKDNNAVVLFCTRPGTDLTPFFPGDVLIPL